jgi:hypothetical protein
LIKRKKLGFSVSPKAAVGGAHRRLMVPALLIAGYAIACFIGGVVRLELTSNVNVLAFWINTAWSGWILALALAAVMTTARSVDYRRTPRAHAALPVRWRVAGIEGIGVLADLSEGGAALLLPRAVRKGDTVSFQVLWSKVSLRASGVVRRAQTTDAGTLVGLEWDEPTGTEALKLSRLAIDLTARHYLLDFDHPPDRIGQLPLTRRHRRASPRKQVAVPLQLGTGDDAPWAVTEDVSAAGALVLSPIEIPVGTRLDVSRWDSEPVSVEVMRCQAVNLPPGKAWRLGLRVNGALLTTGVTTVANVAEPNVVSLEVVAA